MKDPQEALDAARKAAARSPERAAEPPDWLADPSLTSRRLMEWAIIEPERAKVYSTRRYGRPITALKQLLVRLLRQYLLEVTAQQSRFNSLVAAQVIRLEERVAALESQQAGKPPQR